MSVRGTGIGLGDTSMVFIGACMDVWVSVVQIWCQYMYGCTGVRGTGMGVRGTGIGVKGSFMAVRGIRMVSLNTLHVYTMLY